MYTDCVIVEVVSRSYRNWSFVNVIVALGVD